MMMSKSQRSICKVELTDIIAVTFPKTTACMSAPINMIKTENIFSISVFAETFPKPTEVKDERVKYNDVIYRLDIFGPSFFITLYRLLRNAFEKLYVLLRNLIIT